MFDEPYDPILVDVIDGRYEAHALTDTACLMDAYQIGFLQGMGGVSDEVPPGRYLFKVEQAEDALFASLEPLLGD